MAVTYADLVAFGFAYVEDNVSINFKKQKLSSKKTPMPLLSSEDMCLCQEEDFIIFAEFSEVKGPIALFTVPSYKQHDDKIDVNSFIMRIMSVDYQANPGGQFCICQDTQILQTHVSQGRHAYVHYFTLYDLRARGFVRPLCLAYISSDHHKLHRIFPQLRDHFSKVTQVMKVNNRQHFKNEISNVLITLSNVQTNNQETVEDSISTNDDLTIQEGQQSEDFKFMLNIVELSLVDVEYTLATLDHWHQALTFKDESSGSKEVQDYLTLITSAAHCKHVQSNENFSRLEKQLRPIPVLSPWGTPCALALLIAALQNFGGCALSVSVGCFPNLSLPQSNAVLSRKEQDDISAWDSISKSDFLQLLQAIAVGALDASTPTLDEDDCDHAEGSSSKGGTSGNEGSSSYHSFSDSNCDVQAKLSLNRSSARSSLQASIDLSQATFPVEDQKSILDSFHSLNVSSSLSKQEIQDDFHSTVDDHSSSVQQSSNSITNDDTTITNGQSMDDPSSSESGSSIESESFHDILEVLHIDDNWSVGSDDASLPLGAAWDHCLWTRQKPVTKSGHRLLKFFWTYRSAAQHVIYSLLTGRTLVLTGDSSSEQRVQRVMSALSPLVPPLDRNGLRVLRWHQGILVSAHIASYQIIGMCIPERLSIHDMISPRDKNSVTILDVNTEQLLGPAYHGHLLASIGNNVRDFPSDHSLLLFLESILHGIGRKLRTYKALVSACESELPSHACRQLELHGCDADIIRYLSKLSL